MADDRKPKEQQGLPEGWKWVKLGEVAKITTGNSNVQDASDDGVYPFFDRSGEIKRSERYFLDTEAVIVPGEGSDFFPKYFKGKFDLHQRTYAIFNFKGLDGRFLFHLMHLLRVNLIRTAVGTTVLSLRLPHFQNLEFPLPPLPEQRKIAQILETVDNAIEKTEKIIEKYKRIKQGLMQDLLTKGIDEKGNIRSEKTHKFKDSPLGRIPEEWEVVRLGDISKVKRGASPRPIDDPIFFTEEGKGRAWVRIEDVVKSNKYLTETRQYLSKLGESKSVKVDVGDFVMSICATVGKPIIINIPACIHDGFVVFKNLSHKVDRHFLYYLITFKEKEIAKLGQIGTQGNLNSKIVSDFTIPLPPLSEQKRIAEILTQIDQAIEKEEKYKQKLERLKKGLMEDLLTGKVRVNKLVEGESHEMA